MTVGTNPTDDDDDNGKHIGFVLLPHELSSQKIGLKVIR